MMTPPAAGPARPSAGPPHRRTGRRTALAAATLAAAVAAVVASSLALAPAVSATAAAGGTARAAAATGSTGYTNPVLPPTETVTTQDSSDCARKLEPPAAQDTSEAVPSGSTAPTPPPVPDQPVGGGQLGKCGVLVPAGSKPLPPDISAKAWLIADLTTGDVLAAKDPHGRYRPASTQKLLAMNVFLRNLKDLDKVVTGTAEDADQEGSRVGIGPGGKYTVKQLMTYLLLGSGNDVAHALARANGGVEKTVTEMNQRAKALGALDTYASTVSGLDGPGQMTSAYDLALITRSDLRLKPFAELDATRYAKVPGYGDYEAFSIANENQLLTNYPGGIGGKTGFTDSAGNSYVGIAERDGRRLVVTMLAGTQYPRKQWMQAASLLDWGFALDRGAAPIGRLVNSGSDATAGAPSAAPAPSRTGTVLVAPTTVPRSTMAVPSVVPDTRDPGVAAAGTGSGTSGSGVVVWGVLAAVLLAGAVAVVVGLRVGGSRSSDRQQ